MFHISKIRTEMLTVWPAVTSDLITSLCILSLVTCRRAFENRLLGDIPSRSMCLLFILIEMSDGVGSGEGVRGRRSSQAGDGTHYVKECHLEDDIKYTVEL